MTEKKTKKPEKAIDRMRRLARQTPEVIPEWYRDPVYRDRLREMVRAARDFEKVRIATNNRQDSPTEDNKAQLMGGDLEILLALGEATGDLEKTIKSSMQYFLRQSEVGLWLLDQRGLGSGWLAGYCVSEFPDVYDAAICLECGTYLRREADMSYTHPRLVGERKCSYAPVSKKPGEKPDPVVMPEGTYRMHERKPSTWVQFAGLGTEPAWACPKCGYLLRWNGAKKAWVHPIYTNIPKGREECPLNGKVFTIPFNSERPCIVDDGPGGLVHAHQVNASPKRKAGHKNAFKSELRAKMIGPKGVVDAFIMQKHEKYYGIYAGYKNRVQQRDPWRSGKWIDTMARRAVASRFIIDFFVKARTAEGLPCRPPYEEEKLGIVHHD